MNNKKYYTQKSKEYFMSGSRKRHILELIDNNVKKIKILDLGCGQGEMLKELEGLSCDLFGADISEESKKISGKNIKNIFCFDFEKKWAGDITQHKFDLIICTEVMEHIFNTDDFLKNIKNVLNENSELIITIPNILFWKNRLKIFFGKFDYEKRGLMDYGHIRFFTIKTARKIFKKNGFKIVKENHIYPNFDKRNLGFIGKRFPGLFAYQLVFLLKI